MTGPAGWRAMRPDDIAAVSAMSDAVHGRFTERPEVYAERLSLYPAGCFVLERGGERLGYLVTHPWPRRTPVPLDTLLGAPPPGADGYYIHDLALLPAARGSGAGKLAVGLALAQAAEAGCAVISLVAVNGADAFWAGQGFARVADEAVSRKLRSYGDGTVFMERAIDPRRAYPRTSATGV